MAPQLIKMDGDVQGQGYPISKSQLVFGRAAEADIQLESRFASRHHAEVHYADGIYTLYVPEGKQVALNGSPIQGQSRLNPGDIIDFPEERFLFGERKVEMGAGGAGKPNPMPLIIGGLLLAFAAVFIWLQATKPNIARAPNNYAVVDTAGLKELTRNRAELDVLYRAIFFRADYVTALKELNNVGTKISPEDRDTIREVIMGLIRVKVVNEYVDGERHFATRQLESARTNYNTVVRYEELFDQENDKKAQLPPHPVLARNGITVTVEEALARAHARIESCDALLSGKDDPHLTGDKPAAEKPAAEKPAAAPPAGG